jgi:hypothetical protein
MVGDADIVGFCGLYCGRCVFYVDGKIREASQSLWSHLRGLEIYAERMGEGFPALRAYQEFEDVLGWFASQDCPGCRRGGGVQGCSIRACCGEKGLELCSHCDRFPCAEVHGQMITNSNRIREAGVEAFVAEEKSKIGFV